MRSGIGVKLRALAFRHRGVRGLPHRPSESASAPISRALIAVLTLAATVTTPARSTFADECAGADAALAPRISCQEAPEEGQPSSEQERRGTLGVQLGYGVADEIAHSLHIDIASIVVRWSRVFGSAGQPFLGGRPGFAMEFAPMRFAQTPTAYAAGVNFVYEHHFVTSGDVLPILRLGAGFLRASEEVPTGETSFNFSLLAGLGLDVPIGEGRALSFEYRLHHVSNANIGPVNPGINTHTLLAGVTFTLR